MTVNDDTLIKIPRRGHYIWYGARFPYMNAVAIKTALLRSGLDEIWLWHSDALETEPYFREVCSHPRIVARRLSVEGLLGELREPPPFDTARLSEMYGAVRSHVTRSNIARALILYVHGGVYFDIDTLCCKSFEPLLTEPAFVGTEHVIWPQERRARIDAYRLLWGPLLGQLRDLTAWLPGGDELYRKTRGMYATAVNGAILGGRPRHAFFEFLLRKTAEVPKARWQIKHVLGTHVLQQAVTAYAGSDLTLLEPRYFYPLGPVVSRQYFRRQHDVGAAVDRIVSPQTLAIHWYASVSDLSHLDEAKISDMARTTVFGRLCQQITGDLPQAAE